MSTPLSGIVSVSAGPMRASLARRRLSSGDIEQRFD